MYVYIYRTYLGSVGENAVYDLEVGVRYVLRVTTDDFGDEDVELVRRIYVPQTNECSVVLINDGITFDGAMLEMEFSEIGGATEFECRVDESDYLPCKLKLDGVPRTQTSRLLLSYYSNRSHGTVCTTTCKGRNYFVRQ